MEETKVDLALLNGDLPQQRKGLDELLLLHMEQLDLYREQHLKELAQHNRSRGKADVVLGKPLRDLD